MDTADTTPLPVSTETPVVIPPVQSAPEMTEAASSEAESLSIVIPAMNEEDSLDELHQRLLSVCQSAQRSVQIVFVDDGSTDSTWQVMSRLVSSKNSEATRFPAKTIALRLRRNFGKAAALSAGFSVATGDIVMTMDADLQDDPDEIPRFLEKLNGPLDVVSGWKRVRHDPWHKVFPSRVFNALVSRLTGVKLHDHNCGFKAYRRQVLGEVDLYGERHRFIPVLAAARGWRVGEIEVLHHARQHGSSKYGVSRLGKGFLDLMSVYLLTGYGRRPLHLIGSAGLLCFGVGALGMMYLSGSWVWSRLGEAPDVHLHERAVFYYCILAVLLGAQCVLAGLIAELIVSQSAARDRSLRAYMAGTERDCGIQSATRLIKTFGVSEWVGLPTASKTDHGGNPGSNQEPGESSPRA